MSDFITNIQDFLDRMLPRPGDDCQCGRPANSICDCGQPICSEHSYDTRGNPCKFGICGICLDELRENLNLS